MEFVRDIEELLHEFDSRKDILVRFLRKNFKQDVHYICKIVKSVGRHGGHNRAIYMLTQDAWQATDSS